MRRTHQVGATLVVSLIMLMVLTMLVVSAIRFGNINLQIAGNTQAEVEATSAAQVAIETTIQDEVIPAENLDAIGTTKYVDPADDPDGKGQISTGGIAYDVTVAAPSCLFSKVVKNEDLDPTLDTDIPCFESPDADKFVDASGGLTTTPSACNDQQWNLQADVNDPGTGVQLSMVQGLEVRVSAGVACD